MVYPSFSLFEEKNYKPNLDLNKAKIMISQIKNQVLISDIWANDFSIGKISQISTSATHWWYRKHANPNPFLLQKCESTIPNSEVNFVRTHIVM